MKNNLLCFIFLWRNENSSYNGQLFSKPERKRNRVDRDVLNGRERERTTRQRTERTKEERERERERETKTERENIRDRKGMREGGGRKTKGEEIYEKTERETETGCKRKEDV